MASKKNKHGLKRDIPEGVKREVRQRSRFGCVRCRSALYQFEHIDPPYEDATRHDPDRMCCLCGSCHEAVTRGHLSKQSVLADYQRVQTATPEGIGPPVGPLDFHEGHTELLIGQLLYAPAVQVVLRYHGTDLIKVTPGQPGRRGSISAIFTDTAGKESLRLDANEWTGAIDNWDIEVTGSRIVVRRRLGEVALQLRLDPPGRIVVERLDMRYADSHVIATDQTYVVGRYIGGDRIAWARADIRIQHTTPRGVAIEFAHPSDLKARQRSAPGGLTTSFGLSMLGGSGGFVIPNIGVSIGSYCQRGTSIGSASMGVAPLARVREVALNGPSTVGRFIAGYAYEHPTE